MADEPPTIRVLCLGNDLIADDAVGVEAAELIRRRLPDVEVLEASAAGFYLLDDIVGADRLIVVDAVVLGTEPPGTIHVFEEGEVAVTPGGSPHYVGLFETLEMARALGLGAPEKVTLVCVEVQDTTSIGGAMTAPVRAALPRVVQTVEELVSAGRIH